MRLFSVILGKSVYHVRNDILKVNGLCRNFCNYDYGDVAYPKMIDISYNGERHRRKKKWHDKIGALPTVEEKLIEINMPSYYGWRSLNLNEHVIPYNSLSFTQSITRTHFIQINDISSINANRDLDSYCSQLLSKFKTLVTDLLLYYHKNARSDDKCELVSSLVKQLNSLIVSNLWKKCPHLADTQVDYDPRVESFWITGGMEPTYSTMKSRKNVKWLQEMASTPEDRNIQYVGYPVLQIRHTEPLPPIIDLNDSENPDLAIPFFEFDPRVLGLQLQRRHGTSIPGFWPGDPCEFSIMSFHKCNHLRNRPEVYGTSEHAETLHCQAILASFGWLIPIANYQGFSTFNDVTYPLVTQTVITDGQIWSFYIYQLNTTLLHSSNCNDNLRRNICWGSPSMKLFEKIEDGKIIGLNDDVLKILLKLYLKKPQKKNVEMKPYLSKGCHVANIPDDEKREWLERRFKHLFSLSPRSRPMPEIFHWEKIYKIDHQTRPMEARRRPFERGINAFKRRLDEHTPAYIPKALRISKKKKWAKTYYP